MVKDIWKILDKGDVDCLRELLSSDPGAVDITSTWGTSPLQIAVQVGIVESVDLLLEFGADPNRKLTIVSPVSGRTETGMVALMFARKRPIIDALVAGGADVNISDGAGRSVLFVVAQSKRLELVEGLFMWGARFADGEKQQLLSSIKEELQYRATELSDQNSRRVQALKELAWWCERE